MKHAKLVGGPRDGQVEVVPFDQVEHIVYDEEKGCLYMPFGETFGMQMVRPVPCKYSNLPGTDMFIYDETYMMVAPMLIRVVR